jgi:hypothetical protein
MPDEVENHIVKKYEIKKRLGKGVSLVVSFFISIFIRFLNMILFD